MMNEIMKDERMRIVNALRLKYEAEVAVAKINIENYLSRSVGVAEHPHLIESLDGLISELSTAEDKLECIRKDNFSRIKNHF